MERTPVEQIENYRNTCLTPVTEAQLTPEIQEELELNFRFVTAFYLCPENSQRIKDLILKGATVTPVVYWGEDLLNLIKSGEPVFWSERAAMRHYLLAHWRGAILTGLLGYFDVLDELGAIFEAEHAAIVNGTEITKENFKCLSKREREDICSFHPTSTGMPGFIKHSRMTEEDISNYSGYHYYLGAKNAVVGFCKFWKENN